MKKLIIFFVSFSFVFLPIPIFGIYTQNKTFSYSIFNYSYSLYLLGISSDEEKTVLGNNEWMFLGNSYGSVIDKSKDNYEVSTEQLDSNERFFEKINLISKKVNADFKFVVAPNKHSIYGENIGFDTKVGAYSYYNYNKRHDNSDMVSHFRKIKKNNPRDLYFKTDTHWNDLGAFHGYQYIMTNTLNGMYKKLPYNLNFSNVEHNGGDLARFINITDYVSDKNVSVTNKVDDKVIRINLKGYEEIETNIQGDITNSEIKNPIKIINVNALNDLTILWLHDSFGRAMSPYMHLTFREITHQHYSYAFENMLNFEQLAKDTNPDIIIISVVERNAFVFGAFMQ